VDAAGPRPCNGTGEASFLGPNSHLWVVDAAGAGGDILHAKTCPCLLCKERKTRESEARREANKRKKAEEQAARAAEAKRQDEERARQQDEQHQQQARPTFSQTLSEAVRRMTESSIKHRGTLTFQHAVWPTPNIAMIICE
jgi:hypothetical protein